MTKKEIIQELLHRLGEEGVDRCRTVAGRPIHIFEPKRR